MADFEKQWHATAAALLKSLTALLAAAGILFAALEPQRRPSAEEVVRASVLHEYLNSISSFLHDFVGSSTLPARFVVNPSLLLDDHAARLLRDLKVTVNSLVHLNRELNQLHLQGASPALRECQGSPPNGGLEAVLRSGVTLPTAINESANVIRELTRFGLMDKDAYDLTLAQILRALQILGGAVYQDLRNYVFFSRDNPRWLCDPLGLRTIRGIARWSDRDYRLRTPWHADFANIWQFAVALSANEPVVHKARDELPRDFAISLNREREQYKSLLDRYLLRSGFQLQVYLPSLKMYWAIAALPLWMATGYVFMLVQITMLQRMSSALPRSEERFRTHSAAESITLAWTRPGLGLVPFLLMTAPVIVTFAIYGYTLFGLDSQSTSIEVLRPELVNGILRAIPTRTEFSVRDISAVAEELRDLGPARTVFWGGAAVMISTCLALLIRISAVKQHLAFLKA